MRDPGRPLSPDVRALLDREREIMPLAPTVRARSLIRARAALVAGIGRRVAPAPASRIRRVTAVAAVCILSAAVSAAAFQIRARFAPPPGNAPAASQIAMRPTTQSTQSVPSSQSAAPIAEVPPAPARVSGKPALSPADVARPELRLLRQARAAVAREDYGAALPTIAEHARRFKDGRLSEEREALRVKALAGLGRMEEARRAAASFRTRFPRSVLLPAVSQMPAAEP